MGNGGSGIKSRWCRIVLYPESQQAAIEWVQQNMACAWALHDKDVYTEHEYQRYIDKHGEAPEWNPGDLKKEHVHFVCQFPNPRYFSGVARAISKGSGIEVPVNYIERCDHGYHAYVYLWHKRDPDKYQYDENIVGMHEFDVPSERGAGMSQAEDEQVRQLLDMPSFATFGEMGRWVYENGLWASFRKNYSLWKDIYFERKRNAELETKREEDASVLQSVRELVRPAGFIRLEPSPDDPFN